MLWTLAACTVVICRRCTSLIEVVRPPHCLTCGHPFYGELAGERICPHCENLRPEFGAYGASYVQSPNLDRLAKSGITFNRSYCQQAVCSPTRSSSPPSTAFRIWTIPSGMISRPTARRQPALNAFQFQHMTNDPQQLDIAALARYLQDHVPGFEGPVVAEKFSGGQSNPTFLLRTPKTRYVLRRQPPGELLKSAHAVDREFRILTALSGTAVPVARPYHLCEDRNVIGSLFYVMSFEDGRIFWNPALPELSQTDRTAAYDAMLRTMAALHDIDVETVGLADYGKPGNYFERQIGISLSLVNLAQFFQTCGADLRIGFGQVQAAIGRQALQQDLAK